MWAFEGQELPNIGLNAVAGRPPEEYAMDPQSFDDMRPGCYDIHERVKDMNANGVLGSMCFPSFPQFCGQLFARTAATRTSRRGAGAGLQRLAHRRVVRRVPGPVHPARDPADVGPELMAAEVRRVAEKGCHAVTFSENPVQLGHPSIHSDHWDPFWRRAPTRAPSCACTSARRRRW